MDANQTETQNTIPKDLLAAWLARREEPMKADDFIPTDDRPFLRVEIGRMNNEPVYAYGTRIRSFGVTGVGLCQRVTIHYWRWALSIDEARRHIALEAFLRTDKAYEWMMVGLSAHTFADQLYSCRTLEDGTVVYRVKNRRGAWELCIAEDVCAIMHEGLHAFCRPKLPPEPSHGELVTDTPVPDIEARRILGCPHCHQSLTGYIVLGLYNHYRPSFLWISNEQEARATHAATVQYFHECAVQHRAEESAKLERELIQGIWNAAYDLRYSDLYRRHEKMVEASLVADFDRTYGIGLDHMTLDEAEQLEKATKALQMQLAKLNAVSLREIADHGLDGRLCTLLQERLTSCPVCTTRYTWTNELTTTLLMEGRLRPACECDNRGLVSPEQKPLLLREHAELKRVMQSEPDLRDLGTYYDVVYVTVGGVRIVRLALNYSDERLWVFMDRAAFTQTTGKSVALFVWAERKAKAIEYRADRYEAQANVGTVLKLRFCWSDRYQNWSAHAVVGDAPVTYVIHRDHEGGMQTGWWYCRLVNPNGTPRRVIGVIPMATVPNKYIPTNAAHATTPSLPRRL